MAVSELDGKDSNAARAAVDEDPLVRLEFGVIEERLPGGQGTDGDGSRFFVGEGYGFWRDAGWLGNAEFGQRAVSIPVIETIDRLINGELFYAFTLCHDDA